jgi:hypothetical protein
LAVRFADFFLGAAFFVFFAEAFRFPGVTLRTTSLVVSPMDFCAAPALAAKLPKVEPIVSAALTNSPLLLSSALLSSAMYAPRLLGYRQKVKPSEQLRTHAQRQRVRIVPAFSIKLNANHPSRAQIPTTLVKF